MPQLSPSKSCYPFTHTHTRTRTHTHTHTRAQCSNCMKEALYNCCCNANYCSEACQQAHWPDHMKSCSQAQQCPTPAPDGPASPQQPRTLTSTAGTPTDPQAFVFAAPPPPQSIGRPNSHIILPHPAPSVAMATQQSHREIGGSSEPLVQFSESAAHSEQQQQSHAEHSGLEKAMARIEHVPNDPSVLGSHATGQHMLLLHQPTATHTQHSLQPGGGAGQTPSSLQPRAAVGSKNSVISSNSLMRGHGPSVSLYQPLMAQVVDSPRDASPHNLPVGLPRPSSPASPGSEHSSVHNPPGFSWPYQQPVIINSSDGYPLPLLQPSAPVAQPQHQSYFKTF